uniref:Uncharacterized protein n=1 Tax=Parascaris univalens TaxID=6257 RepID=A0A915BWK8_PARUN
VLYEPAMRSVRLQLFATILIGAMFYLIYAEALSEETITDLLVSDTEQSSTISAPIEFSPKKSTSDEDEQRFYEIRIHSISVALGTILVCSPLTAFFYFITVIRLARLHAPSKMPII